MTKKEALRRPNTMHNMTSTMTHSILSKQGVSRWPPLSGQNSSEVKLLQNPTITLANRFLSQRSDTPT